MQYIGPGGQMENVLNFQFTSGPDADQLSQLGADLRNWFHSTLRPQMSSDVSLQQIVLTDLTTDSGAQIVDSTDLPQAGSAAFNVMPSNVTVAISFRTALRGRSNRGRAYWIGMVDENVVGDSINSGFQAALIAAWGELLGTPFITNGETLVIVSRCHARAWRTTAQVTPVQSILVDPTIDSQRRRLAGRGA